MIHGKRKAAARGARRQWLGSTIVFLVCFAWFGPIFGHCDARHESHGALGERGNEKDIKKEEKKNEKRPEFVSKNERKRLLAMASATLDGVWGTERNILEGPIGAPAIVDPASGAITHLKLTYFAEKGVAGRTHKFWGRDSEGKKWKVKYDSEEVFTEMAATRLMWKMGYAADHAFPVRELICIGCKDENPWSSMDHGRDPPIKGSKIVFQNVIIERALQHFLPQGHKVETFDGEGVELVDISKISDGLWQTESGRAAELDSLKALAFMLQHADSKPANQKIVAMRWPDDGRREPNRVVVFLQDPGVSFGRGKGALAVSRFKYDRWRERLSEPWISSEGLVLRLPKIYNAEGGWQDPSISEAGLSFFLDRAARIDRQDLIDVFRLARFPEGSGVSTERWADTWELGIENLRSRLPGSSVDR